MSKKTIAKPVASKPTDPQLQTIIAAWPHLPQRTRDEMEAPAAECLYHRQRRKKAAGLAKPRRPG